MTPTIRASQGGEGIGIAIPPCPEYPSGLVRKLSVTEMERLLGFGDGYTALNPDEPHENARQRRRALGNTFAVPVVRWIGRRIKLYEEFVND